jgi:3'(2'), 5'-bisphosphate nucleotidase
LNPGSDISPAQALELMDDLSALVARACAEIGATTTVDQRLKPDQSPVTAADEASEAVILQGLARILPKMPVVAEESASAAAPADLTGSFVIVDPLDGTREFLAGRDEFTINLAIVTRGLPVAGIIAAPKLDSSGAASSATGRSVADYRTAVPVARTQSARGLGRTPRLQR